MRTLLGVAMTIPLCWVSAAYGSGDYETLADKTLKAFRCAKYAEMADVATQRDRLFQIAMDAGADTLKSMREQSVTEDSITNRNSAAAVVVTVVAKYHQSDDFILGRLFERSSRVALKIFEKGPPDTLGEYQKIARGQFDKEKCDQI